MHTNPISSKKKGILIVTPLLPPESGGPSYYSVALKDAFEKKGKEVELIAFREVRKYPKVLRHILFLYKVLWVARKVDVLIILDTVSVALPAVIAGWVLNKKMIVRVGGDFVWERYVERTGEKVLLSEFYLPAEKKVKKYSLSKKEKLLIWLQKNVVCTLATKIVFNTEWQRDLWEKPYAISKEKTGVIVNAFTKSEYRYKGGESFLYAGRSIVLKNLEILEHACVLAQEKYPPITIKKYNNIPRDTLYTYMQKSRAIVIPSLSEVSPNMALEALGMGLPVLLTKDCGAYDLLDGVVTWIDPRDTHDIALKMLALMDDTEYEKAKEKARAFTFTHTYDDIAEEFLALLK
jgi:glycosyltransferase involved in cell wall biosynthesis